MRYLNKTAILALVLAISAACWAAPMNNSFIPATTKWIFHIDLEAFSSTAIGQHILTEIRQQHKQKLEAATRLFGSDLTQDITGLTLFGPDEAEANAVAMISGRFDQPKLLALLAASPDYGSRSYGEHTLYQWKDARRNKNQVGVFAADDLIVISQTEKAVTDVLDVMAGRQASLASAPKSNLSLLTEGAQGAFFVAAADELAALTQNAHHAAMLQNSRTMTLIADEKEEQTRLYILLEAQSLEAAQQVEQVARGMLAFAMLQQKNPDLVKLAASCSITRTDDRVAFEFTHPSAGLLDMLKTIAPRQPKTE